MDEALFLTMFQKAIFLIMAMGAPILLSAIVVGLAISIIQSVTQIQEQTLTFVPKIFAALLILIVSAPWMIKMFISATKEMFEYITVFIS
ncbi:MAG: flagellar biosynthetic protein FliQ [Candidatus Gastranaerophilales bacterium]|nr:flagellar biosynthetic protein FliQ [Candidatus Gastranaerophilales bacterium]